MVADLDWGRPGITRLIHSRGYRIRLGRREDTEVFRQGCLILRFVIGFNAYYRRSTCTRPRDHQVTA